MRNSVFVTLLFLLGGCGAAPGEDAVGERVSALSADLPFALPALGVPACAGSAFAPPGVTLSSSFATSTRIGFSNIALRSASQPSRSNVVSRLPARLTPVKRGA